MQKRVLVVYCGHITQIKMIRFMKRGDGLLMALKQLAENGSSGIINMGITVTCGRRSV